MNNKGTAVFLLILFAVFYFIAGMILYQFLKPVIDQSRIDVACSATTTSGDRILCTMIDSVIPIVVLVIISVALAYATGGRI